MTSYDALLDRFFAAIEAGDAEAIAAHYAEDVVVWNNVAKVHQTKAENLQLLDFVMSRMTGMHYEVLERIEQPGGVTQRHVLHGRIGDEEIALDVCIVFRIEGDRITHIFEYLDSAPMSPLFRRS